LGGKPAQQNAPLLAEARHLVSRSPPPSPLSAYRRFFGSKPFSQINQWLQNNGSDPIPWALPQ